jgi:hypothetical protein
MKKLATIFFMLFTLNAYSENLIGGEITCRNINGLMYETTLILYRNLDSSLIPANYSIIYRDSLDSIIATHTVQTPSGMLEWNSLKVYRYIDTITFPNIGNYKISTWDCCRDTLNNIINSTNYGMYIDCQIMVDGFNSSPYFLRDPIILAQKNLEFLYSIMPYDADGDSLSWELANPEDLQNGGIGGFNIVSIPYTYPPSDSSSPFRLDSNLGSIICKPNIEGEFQFAVKIVEWRNGVQIGYIRRDMLLKVIHNSNRQAISNVNIHIITNGATTYLQNWTPGTMTPNIYLNIGSHFYMHLATCDSDYFVWSPDAIAFGNSLINTSAGWGTSNNLYWNDLLFDWVPNIADVNSRPYYLILRQFESIPSIFRIYRDFTFRIFITNTTTSINEISNDTKSVYLKSIDLLGRETDPNLPGFRIDLYSDGKTKKVFRGE